MKKTVVLAILDGWGIGRFDESNPIYAAHPQFEEYLRAYFPYGALKASGVSVGLAWREAGSSNAGHLTIGSGRVTFQNYPRISMAIKDGSFFENPALRKAFLHARNKSSGVHLAGLLTEGHNHASFDHLVALLEMAKKENCSQVYLHLFLDGVDSQAKSALSLLERLEVHMKDLGVGVIASVAGRSYALNRDGSWNRTEMVYGTMVGEGRMTASYKQELEEMYQRNLNDEFMEPLMIHEPHLVQDSDAVIFFNFREDGVRQIAAPFVMKDFKEFSTRRFEELLVVTMTEYFKDCVDVAFPKEEDLKNTLSEVLSLNGKSQAKITESVRRSQVMYYFNGLREEGFSNEYRVVIPSEQPPRPEDAPKMRAHDVTDRALASLNDGAFDFVLATYANSDVMARTGNFSATLAAVRVIDNEMLRLINKVLDSDHALIITSGHGNAEEVLGRGTGSSDITNNSNPVPFYLVGREFGRVNEDRNPYAEIPTIGMLSDVAPTILGLLNIPTPDDMTGESLLGQLV